MNFVIVLPFWLVLLVLPIVLAARLVRWVTRMSYRAAKRGFLAWRRRTH